MGKTKVVQLTTVHPVFDTRIFRKECKSLLGAGYDVVLIAPHDHDEVVDGIKIEALARPKWRFSRMTRTVYQAYRKAVRQRAQIYHFHDPELIPAGLLLRARGRKVIYDVHEDYPRHTLEKYYLPGWVSGLLGWLVEHLENMTGGIFSALIPATPAIGERFTKLNPRTVVIQNYALAGEFAPQVEIPWRQRPSSVAYLGGINRERGIPEIIKAMSLLDDDLGATLKLVGAFQPASLQEEVSRLPGWTRVEALGELARPEVADVLGQVRAGLCCFHAIPNHVRAQPNKIFEYMSAGIPVIASNFPLWGGIVQGSGCGLLVDPLNPHAIADAIRYVLTHPEEAELMGRRGREAVINRFNWRNEERKLLELYGRLADPGCGK